MPSDNRVRLDNSSCADDGTLPDVNARGQVGRGVDRDGPREIPGEPLGQLDAGVVRSDGDDGESTPSWLIDPRDAPPRTGTPSTSALQRPGSSSSAPATSNDPSGAG